MATKKLRLSHACDEYIARRRFSTNTATNYRSMLNTLIDSIGTDVYLENVTAVHLDKYVTNRYRKVSSANQRIAQLRAFFDWCVKNQYLRNNPALLLERGREQREGALTKHRIPPEEWGHLLAVAGEQHPVNRIVTAMGLFLGQRGNELAAIRLKDLNRDDDGTIVSVTVNRKKVGEIADVPVFADLAEEIELWLEWYTAHNGDAFGNLPPNAYLLPARKRAWSKKQDGSFAGVRRDTPVDPHMPLGRPYRVVQQVLKATGWYEKGEGAHTLRRSLAVCLYQADLDNGYSGALQNVQTMLGHRSVQTTEGYLGSSLGKHRLDKRVRGQRLIKPAQAVTSDNVIEMRRDNG